MIGMKKLRTQRKVQLLSAVLTNPHLTNFFTGRIYKGPFKNLCSPGLNCYSCPAAGLSCPIGALQTVSASNRFRLSYYVVGFLIILGAIFGRMICGFFCVFGFLQDLLYKIPLKKITLPEKLDKALRYLKYLILLIFVILLPLLITNEFGLADPFFCKYICPAGTIEGGIPLLLMNASLRDMAGSLFLFKLVLAIICILAVIMIPRAFCRYICPLGAIYSLFQKVSLVKLTLEEDKCISCNRCKTVCPMGVDVLKDVNSLECIRCGKCVDHCHTEAIKWNLKKEISSMYKEI